MNPTSENNMSMDNLPDNVIPLGNSQFLVVRSFQGHTRIHIRKFFEDNRQLHPTKDGVSLAPRVWVTLTEKLPKLLSKRYFDRYPNDYMEVVERDLCVVKGTITSPVEHIEINFNRFNEGMDPSNLCLKQFISMRNSVIYCWDQLSVWKIWLFTSTSCWKTCVRTSLSWSLGVHD